jgi:hypothetical protein
MIVEEAGDDLLQPFTLFGYRLMHPPSQFPRNLLDLRGQTTARDTNTAPTRRPPFPSLGFCVPAGPMHRGSRLPKLYDGRGRRLADLDELVGPQLESATLLVLVPVQIVGLMQA